MSYHIAPNRHSTLFLYFNDLAEGTGGHTVFPHTIPPSVEARAKAVADIVRHFNLREGLEPVDDRLPKGFYRESDGDNPLTPGELESMLTDYYRLRGWDERGRPPV